MPIVKIGNGTKLVPARPSKRGKTNLERKCLEPPRPGMPISFETHGIARIYTAQNGEVHIRDELRHRRHFEPTSARIVKSPVRTRGQHDVRQEMHDLRK